MKILQLLSNPGIGGTESFVIGLVPKLRSMGIDVHLANLWDGGGEAIEVSAPNGIPCHALQVGRRRFRASAPWVLRRFLKREKFDLVMAYGLRTTLLLRFAAAYRGRPVLVTGIRNMDDWRKWYHVMADRWTDGLMDWHVGVSTRCCVRRVEREKASAEKILYIPNGIDTAHFNREAKAWPSREELRLAPTGRLVVTVGHLRGQKGYPFQMDVIRHMLSVGGYDDVRFVWVGHGPDEQMLRQMLVDKGLAVRVNMYGVTRDVRPIVAHSDVFLMTSWEEGMPRGMMEAMAMRMPIVSTAVGGIPEIVREGENGMLVKYGDVEGTSAALRRMLDSPELRKQYGLVSERRIQQDFSFDAVTRKYADLYTRLVAGDRTVINEYGYANAPAD